MIRRVSSVPLLSRRLRRRQVSPLKSCAHTHQRLSAAENLTRKTQNGDLSFKPAALTRCFFSCVLLQAHSATLRRRPPRRPRLLPLILSLVVVTLAVQTTSSAVAAPRSHHSRRSPTLRPLRTPSSVDHRQAMPRACSAPPAGRLRGNLRLAAISSPLRRRSRCRRQRRRRQPPLRRRPTYSAAPRPNPTPSLAPIRLFRPLPRPPTSSEPPRPPSRLPPSCLARSLLRPSGARRRARQPQPPKRSRRGSWITRPRATNVRPRRPQTAVGPQAPQQPSLSSATARHHQPPPQLLRSRLGCLPKLAATPCPSLRPHAPSSLPAWPWLASA